MKTVSMNKTKLLAIIEDNRTAHIREYNNAVKQYKIDLLNEVNNLHNELTELFNGKTNQTTIEQAHKLSWKPGQLPQPEAHIEDYDRVIEMLRLSVDDHINLSANEFDSYVRNKWAWSDSFVANTRSYSQKFVG